MLLPPWCSSLKACLKKNCMFSVARRHPKPFYRPVATGKPVSLLSSRFCTTASKPLVLETPSGDTQQCAFTEYVGFKLHTTGPVSTSGSVRQAMLHEVGAGDQEVVEMVQQIRQKVGCCAQLE